MDNSVWIVTHSISAEKVSGIHFILNIIQHRIISISDDTTAHFLELLEVVDNLATKECAAILQGRLVDDNGSTFSFDAFHDALDAALTEIVTITLHCKTIDTDDDLLLFIWIEILASCVCACDFKDSLGDEILPGPVAFHDGLNQVFRHILIICQELFGILGQAISAITEGRVVVVIANARIEADSLDDGSSLEPFYFGIGIRETDAAGK